ncbi:MAG: 2-oxo acid dehydrogenase subunit E2 [Solirubrobacterales bacterium]
MSSVVRTPLTRMRRAIAKSMTASAAIPQFTIESEARIAELEAFRGDLAAVGTPISINDALLASCARGLTEHPALNACFGDDAIIEYQERNVAIAVAVPGGLVAPAVRRADTLSLARLRSERERLARAAHEGGLDPADVFAATFTISNLGPFGVRRFQALVSPGQAAIVAVGGVSEEGRLSLSLSCDHRIVDGAPAATFLDEVVGLLERPDWMLGL